MRNLLQYVNECTEELDLIGIDYTLPKRWESSKRLTRKYGYCRISLFRNKPTIEKIVISSRLLDERIPENILKDTIIHELIHTCDGCFNHGREFQNIARQINDAYGYSIGTYVNKNEHKIVSNVYKPKERKYKISCPTCGRIWGYKIKTKAYKHPEEYICSKCKSKLIRSS